MQLSLPKILEKTVSVISPYINSRSNCKLQHLDIGSGTGSLISILHKQHSNLNSRGCDYLKGLINDPTIPVDIVDLDNEKLPYEDNSFDIITCTEVLEHLENHRAVLKEVYRILKPGGIATFSTPNILNFRSRVRFFFSGFYNLFGPLHFMHSEKYSTGGHINPLSLFYLVHSMADAAFQRPTWTVDKWQRGSIPALFFTYPLIKIFAYMAYRKEVTKYHTIDENNINVVSAMNSLNILLGRTIIVTGHKGDLLTENA